MTNPKKGFIKKRLTGVTYSLKGIKILVTTEDSIKTQIFLGLFAIVLGFIFKISLTEWAIQLTLSALVLVAEGLNTAVEKIADFIHPQHHKEIGIIKDVASGAVGFAAITAIIVGGIIYLPKIAFLFS